MIERNRSGNILETIVISALLLMLSCSSVTQKNQAKESAAKYWQDKAYPGKAFDVQVIEAESIEDGKWRVRGLVDGESRVGVFSPDSETFSEGYYSLAHERNKKIAELEQEVRYWKEKFEGLEKEIYKLKVKYGDKADKSDAPEAKTEAKTIDAPHAN
jgi:hypothetical protein